jgi:hypothetical protein
MGEGGMKETICPQHNNTKRKKYTFDFDASIK